MGNDLVERLKKLAHQQADVNGDPSYDGKRMLTHEDTMYWAAAARIEALEEALKPFADAYVNREKWAEEMYIGGSALRNSDLRRAARAYANKGEPT